MGGLHLLTQSAASNGISLIERHDAVLVTRKVHQKIKPGLRPAAQRDQVNDKVHINRGCGCD